MEVLCLYKWNQIEKESMQHRCWHLHTSYFSCKIYATRWYTLFQIGRIEQPTTRYFGGNHKVRRTGQHCTDRLNTEMLLRWIHNMLNKNIDKIFSIKIVSWYINCIISFIPHTWKTNELWHYIKLPVNVWFFYTIII